MKVAILAVLLALSMVGSEAARSGDLPGTESPENTDAGLEDPQLVHKSQIAKQLSDEKLKCYQRYWRLGVKKKDERAKVARSCKLTDEEMSDIGFVVEGHYRWRFLVRQDEIAIILLRANIEEHRKQGSPRPEAMLKQWAGTRERLRDHDRSMKRLSKLFGAAAMELLDRNEETFLEIVAKEQGVTWGRSPDPGALRKAARLSLGD